MTTFTQDIDTAKEQRAEQVAGLHALADFLESHPELPLWYVSANGLYEFSANANGGLLLAVADQLEEFTVRTDDQIVRVERDFGGEVRYVARAHREAVCKPRIVDGLVEWELPVKLAERQAVA